jgi:hypothetical protein
MLFDTKWDAKLTTEPWRQVLLDAANYIDLVGWCQHTMRDDNGRVCAAEALMTVAQTGHDYAGAVTSLSNFVTSGEHSMAVVKWNDDEGCTAAQVTGAMRACAWQ